MRILTHTHTHTHAEGRIGIVTNATYPPSSSKEQQMLCRCLHCVSPSDSRRSRISSSALWLWIFLEYYPSRARSNMRVGISMHNHMHVCLYLHLHMHAPTGHTTWSCISPDSCPSHHDVHATQRVTSTRTCTSTSLSISPYAQAAALHICISTSRAHLPSTCRPRSPCQPKP